jgi:hypothetical protein
LLDETAFVHPQPARGEMHFVEIAVVMGYRNDRYARPM